VTRVTPEELDSLAARVRASEPRLGRTRLVCIDGPAGSGKTTLAAQLADALGGALVVHLDDLLEGWSGLPGVWDRLRDQVLLPLAAGRPGRYQRWDWDHSRWADWRAVPATDVLIVEGVGAAQRGADGIATLKIWVEAPEELRLARGLARDGMAMRDRWLSWQADEAEHFAAEETAGRADTRVNGSADSSA
jgi:uridine kinase